MTVQLFTIGNCEGFWGLGKSSSNVMAVGVSSSFYSLAIMMVLEFPPRLSFSSQVSTESRYGM